jgi:hypothetical protein
MPRVSFTSHLGRHVACPSETVPGATVHAALTAYFVRHPDVRSYVLDEQAALRHHVVIFVGDQQIRDRQALSDVLADDAEIYVMQALSGGA